MKTVSEFRHRETQKVVFLEIYRRYLGSVKCSGQPVMGGGGMRAPHHNFVVIAPMIMKFGTGVKLDVFYTMVTKEFVTSLLLRHYDVITCILVDV